MKILKSLNLGQLQTFNHILTEMEGMGTSSLSEARLIISRATEQSHKFRQSKRYKAPKMPNLTPCPECKTPMAEIEADGMMIFACASCRFSMPVEVD